MKCKNADIPDTPETSFRRWQKRFTTPIILRVTVASKSHTHPSHSQIARLLTSFLSLGVPQWKTSSVKHKWVRILDDTSSPTTIRYQVYGITLRLIPNKDDLLFQTFGSLNKMYPTLGVYCTHYDCIPVFDVTNFHYDCIQVFEVTNVRVCDSRSNTPRPAAPHRRSKSWLLKAFVTPANNHQSDYLLGRLHNLGT